MHMPYCGACAARLRATGLRIVALFALVTLLALALPGAGLVLLKLHRDALPVSAVAAGIAIVLASIAAIALAQKRPAAPATASYDAVAITSFEYFAGAGVPRTARLFCTNQAWAEQLATGNRTTARPATRWPVRGPIAVAWCAVLAIAMVALVWRQGVAHARAQAKATDPAAVQAPVPASAAASPPARAPGGSASAAPTAKAAPATKAPSKTSTPKRK
jgi:hypothetical protein